MPKECSGSCTGLGSAVGIYDGPCQGNAAPQALQKKALDDAKAKAGATCDEGCDCDCTPQLIGQWCHNIPEKNQHVWTVTASCDGECKKQKGKKAAAGPVKSIEARDYRDFFRQVAKLPKLPRHPKGPCQMYQQQHGHGFLYPICAGDCNKGRCTTTVTAKPGSVTAKCDCK